MRAAPLPSARVVVVVGSCGVAQGPMEFLDWSASTDPPASTAHPAKGRVGGARKAESEKRSKR